MGEIKDGGPAFPFRDEDGAGGFIQYNGWAGEGVGAEVRRHVYRYSRETTTAPNVAREALLEAIAFVHAECCPTDENDEMLQRWRKAAVEAT